MYVFIDESCHSGANNFDCDQSMLYSLATVSKHQFEVLAVSKFDAILQKVGVDELHGSELGIGKIDSIAHAIGRIVDEFGLKFVFAQIDKSYLCLTKLFDTLFDSFDNVSVPWHVYNLRPLRMLMMFKFMYLVDFETTKKFWNGCLFEWREDVATHNFIAVCNSILKNIEILPDARSREIISQAILWAIDHPENIVFYFRDKGMRKMGAANFVAFSSLLPEVSRIAKKNKRDVKVVTHDEQGEFASIFKEYHETMKKSKPFKIPNHFASGEFDFSPMKDSTFEICSSSKSYGLQMTDIALFILKKSTEGKVLTGDIGILENKIRRKMTPFFFVKKFAEATTLFELKRIMSMPLTNEQLAEGQRILDEIEAKRVAEMESYDAHQ